MPNPSPPQQLRSVKTQNAISDATKHLLETHTMAELTIDQIVKEAGSSSGSFYARFRGKNALLHFLHEEFARTSREGAKQAVDAVGPEPISVERFADLFVPELVASHVENHGILRATLIEAFDDPGFAKRALELVHAISTTFAELVSDTSKDKDTHVVNIALGIGAVIAVLDQDLFYFPKGHLRKVSDARTNRLKRILVASMNAEGEIS